MLDMGPSLGANVFRGALAPSHGAYSVVRNELTLAYSRHDVAHASLHMFWRRVGLVRTVTINIVLSCPCVLYTIHHGSGLAPLY